VFFDTELFDFDTEGRESGACGSRDSAATRIRDSAAGRSGDPSPL